MAEILEGTMKELSVTYTVEILALLNLEIGKRWEYRSDSYWRDRIKSYVKILRLLRNNDIYLKER
jgi:hypothetical protein